MCSRCRLRMNLPRSMPTPSTIPTPRSPQDEMRAHPRAPPFPGGHLQITKASDLGPDTRQQHDLDTPDGWKRVPLHVGRAPAAGDRDLQPQPVAQPLKALQHAVLGHCETCGLAQRIRPTGAARPSPSRLAVGDRGASRLPPKSRFVTLLALRLGHTRPAGLGCCSYPHSADVVGVFTSVI